jgi:hypothetical protein
MDELMRRAMDIDAYYDEMIDGVPREMARMIEEQRCAAHDKLAREAIDAGLSATTEADRRMQREMDRNRRRNISGDPITRIW